MCISLVTASANTTAPTIVTAVIWIHNGEPTRGPMFLVSVGSFMAPHRQLSRIVQYPPLCVDATGKNVLPQPNSILSVTAGDHPPSGEILGRNGIRAGTKVLRTQAVSLPLPPPPRQARPTAARPGPPRPAPARQATQPC